MRHVQVATTAAAVIDGYTDIYIYIYIYASYPLLCAVQFQLNTPLDIARLIKTRCQRAYATCACQIDVRSGPSGP